MNYRITHAPRVISTAQQPTAVLNAYGEDALVARLVAEYAPHARAKAVADRAIAKAKADSDAAHSKVMAAAHAYAARYAGDTNAK